MGRLHLLFTTGFLHCVLNTGESDTPIESLPMSATRQPPPRFARSERGLSLSAHIVILVIIIVFCLLSGMIVTVTGRFIESTQVV